MCNTGRDLGIDLFDGLSSLVDKNLVQRMDLLDSEARFTTFETIREYALERLVAADEEAATRRAHAAYCLVLAEEGNPELSPAERALWLARCDLEIETFDLLSIGFSLTKISTGGCVYAWLCSDSGTCGNI